MRGEGGCGREDKIPSTVGSVRPGAEIKEESDSGVKDFGCKWLGRTCFHPLLPKFLDGRAAGKWEEQIPPTVLWPRSVPGAHAKKTHKYTVWINSGEREEEGGQGMRRRKHHTQRQASLCARDDVEGGPPV